MDTEKYNTLYNSLNTVYDPAKQLIQQQQAQIPGQFDAERAGLEQAKMNAFRDISSKARGMGVAFGGYSPSEQARYTGTTYLPAMGNIGQRQSAASTALQEALNNIGIKQTESATGMYQTQVANEAAAAQEAAKQAEQQRQFDQQMAMEQYKAQLNASTKGKTLSKFKAIDNTKKDDLGNIIKTGTNFYGENGQPVTAAQYYSGIGGTVDDLYTFLSNDMDKTGQAAAKELAVAGSVTPELVAKYPWIFGG